MTFWVFGFSSLGMGRVFPLIFDRAIPETLLRCPSTVGVLPWAGEPSTLASRRLTSPGP
jgi:hypothetical protein